MAEFGSTTLVSELQALIDQSEGLKTYVAVFLAGVLAPFHWTSRLVVNFLLYP